MYCEKCGAKNQEDAKLCVICRQRLSASSSVGPVATTSVAASAGSSLGATDQAVTSHMLPAILTTLFCCLPFGIVSIIYAADVSGKAASGDIEAARESSRKAKTWWLVSLFVGLGFGLLWILIAVLAAVSSSF